MTTILILTLSITFTPPAFADHLTSQEIDTLIAETMEIRLSNRSQFKQNLIILESLATSDEQAQLSQKQKELIIYLRGYEFAINSKSKQAVAAYKQIQDSKDAEIRAISLSAQLNVAILSSKFTNSYTLIDLLLKNVETLADTNLHKNSAYLMVGYFYNHLEKYQLALNYFSLINQNIMPDKELCTLGHHQALSYLGAKQIRANDEFVISAIENCNLSGDVIIANSLIIENAKYLIAEQQYDLAIANLLENEQVILSAGFSMHNFSLHVLLTTAYIEKKNILAAKINATAAEEMQTNFSISKYNLIFFESLSKLYVLDNQPEKALAYLQLYHQTKQSIADLDLKKKMASAMARHQTIEQSKQLKQLLIDNSNSIATDERLRHENRILEQRVALHFKIIIGLFVFCLALYLLTFWLKAHHQGILNKAYIDSLTGLYSRRYFIDNLAGLIYQQRSLHQHLSLITLCLDDFQQVNNKYGFEHGDYVLKQIEVIVKRLKIDNVLLGRTGATEFCLALENHTQQQALIVAQKLLQELKTLKSADHAISYDLNVCIGVSDTELAKYVPKNLLADSNCAMHVARAQGKNQIVEFELCMSERSKYIVEDKLTYVFK
ncbi:GGDEF domain-containing protein [Thalassomonas sp. M1454]|uniref:GGDEF domain-containing protein n=1 Tax=Thalassomonas sp. M1454 TaxID=2594477 RepID=UPI00163D8584|nr:GGDEF domain-containing protein [Thalassomonas sp. M1454]